MSFTIGSLFDGLYSVTSDGKLYSARSGRFLKPGTDKYGYLYFVISIGGKRFTLKAHRLVAEAFIPNPDNKPTVNHINEVKTDNRVENLEWATHREQNAHGTRIARAIANTDWSARSLKMNYREIARKHDYENMNAEQMKKVVQRDLAGNVIAVFNSIGQAARNVEISPGHIWQCCNGQRKTCKGCVWEYA